MAKIKINKTVEAEPSKMYMGLGSFAVLAVNPTNKEIAKIYGKDEVDESREEPNYAEVDQETGVQKCRIDFWVKTDGRVHTKEDGSPLDFITKVSIFVENREAVKQDGSGKQLIDDYGNTAWATNECIAEKRIPTYFDKQTNEEVAFAIDMETARVAHKGEDQLISFLQAWLGVGASTRKKDGHPVLLPKNELEDKWVGLETSWEEVCKGNVKELKEYVDYAKDNTLKIAVGIKTNDNGGMYHDLYNKKFWSVKIKPEKLVPMVDKHINNSKAAGSYKNTQFDVSPLHEYKVEATKFDNKQSEEVSSSSPWD